MSGMLRWSSEQHDAWKAREAKRSADQQSTSGSVESRHAPGSQPASPVIGGMRGLAVQGRDQCHPATAGVAPGPLTLPWPPTGNHAVKHGNGNHYLRPEVRAYRAAVAAICANHTPITGPYKLRLELSPPDRRRRDADNAIKQALDALVQAGYLADDSMSYMRELSVIVQDDVRYGWVKVKADPCA